MSCYSVALQSRWLESGCWREGRAGFVELLLLVWAMRHLVAAANTWILFKFHRIENHVNENMMCLF